MDGSRSRAWAPLCHSWEPSETERGCRYPEHNTGATYRRAHTLASPLPWDKQAERLDLVNGATHSLQRIACDGRRLLTVVNMSPFLK
jgi:hypothetical protein